jgi:hypothetical protein
MDIKVFQDHNQGSLKIIEISKEPVYNRGFFEGFEITRTNGSLNLIFQK